ncbi:flagellar biosynthetic protein FliR [Halobacteroides halobius DSM 5150]|uniref:Flagellar biosynthetic protein FliR n=1 Tax=Halobacteroides halobius (strain ATCC 35273 / DSM 5150 / MD-1) TaxID=748449 RepID=U3GLG5_HALHC|nr:flagellar biosynthetic protein FliR [Halobacteroides halobius]AGB40644.1 flagellar biosynthetic protein FliR [Halobacteroides halobius DSM 5150]
MTEEDLLLQVYYFSLILTRIVGLFVLVPIFGSKAIPKRFKIGLAIIITIILMGVISLPEVKVPQLGLLVLQLLTEFTIGLIMGFILLLVFVAVQLAGQLIARRMGLAMANILNPQSGTRVAVIGQLQNIIAILVFLTLNGHHQILRLLVTSFDLINLGQFNTSSDLFALLLRLNGDLFPMAFKIALPILATLFIVDLSFGLVARTVPQLNVFMLGLPLKLLVGLIILTITLPNYISFLETTFKNVFKNIYAVLKLIG